jgi:hypothetical protein
MSKDLHMKMDDGLAADIQAWADKHHVSFTAAVSVLCSRSLCGPDALDPPPSHDNAQPEQEIQR